MCFPASWRLQPLHGWFDWASVFSHLRQLLKQFGVIKLLPHVGHFSFPSEAASYRWWWWWWKEKKKKETGGIINYMARWNDVILPAASLTAAVYLFINPRRLRLWSGCAELRRRARADMPRRRASRALQQILDNGGTGRHRVVAALGHVTG